MVYVNVCILKRLKEGLALAIDKRLQLIINTMLFKTVTVWMETLLLLKFGKIDD